MPGMSVTPVSTPTGGSIHVSTEETPLRTSFISNPPPSKVMPTTNLLLEITGERCAGGLLNALSTRGLSVINVSAWDAGRAYSADTSAYDRIRCRNFDHDRARVAH